MPGFEKTYRGCKTRGMGLGISFNLIWDIDPINPPNYTETDASSFISKLKTDLYERYHYKSTYQTLRIELYHPLMTENYLEHLNDLKITD